MFISSLSFTQEPNRSVLSEVNQQELETRGAGLCVPLGSHRNRFPSCPKLQAETVSAGGAKQCREEQEFVWQD